MANPNILDELTRKEVVQSIKSFENVKRKQLSIREYEVLNDNIKDYVYEDLVLQLSEDTAKQMPIVSTVNFAKAVVNKKANIYTDGPKRSYPEITDSDLKAIENTYQDFGFNTVLSKANKYFINGRQVFLQVVPKDNGLKLRVLQKHNVDVIPDESDPEKAFCYIISSFDKSLYGKLGSDNVNQIIADQDDYKLSLERYQFVTDEVVLTCDGKGRLVDEALANPIGMLNIIDIAKDKDFEFFVRSGSSLTDVTVFCNVVLSDNFFISRLQGHSIPVVSGDANLKPENMILAPNKALFLPTNPANPDSKLSIEFLSPTPNIADSQKLFEMFVAAFMTTEGVDSNAVKLSNNGPQSYSSAIERLLAMIDQFRATKDDFDLFQKVEKKLHKIVTRYLSILSGDVEKLDKKYWVSRSTVDSEIEIQFSKPEMIETKSEMLANAKSEIELGIADQVTVLMKLEGITEEMALERIEKISERKLERMQAMAEAMPEQELQTEGVESNDNTEENPQAR